jgi:hypothetical protein
MRPLLTETHVAQKKSDSPEAFAHSLAHWGQQHFTTPHSRLGRGSANQAAEAAI